MTISQFSLDDEEEVNNERRIRGLLSARKSIYSNDTGNERDKFICIAETEPDQASYLKNPKIDNYLRENKD